MNKVKLEKEYWKRVAEILGVRKITGYYNIDTKRWSLVIRSGLKAITTMTAPYPNELPEAEEMADILRREKR